MKYVKNKWYSRKMSLEDRVVCFFIDGCAHNMMVANG